MLPLSDLPNATNISPAWLSSAQGIDLGELRSAIYATTDHPGVTGTLSCSENGDCGAAIIGVYKVGTETVEDGVFPPMLVWPAE